MLIRLPGPRTFPQCLSSPPLHTPLYPQVGSHSVPGPMLQSPESVCVVGQSPPSVPALFTPPDSSSGGAASTPAVLPTPTPSTLPSQVSPHASLSTLQPSPEPLHRVLPRGMLPLVVLLRGVLPRGVPPVSCLLHPVSCLLSPVSCLLSPVSCVLCPVSCVLCPVSCVLPAVSCLLSPVSCLLSPVSCLLTPVSCVLCPASCLLSPASCLLPLAQGGGVAGCGCGRIEWNQWMWGG